MNTVFHSSQSCFYRVLYIPHILHPPNRTGAVHTACTVSLIWIRASGIRISSFWLREEYMKSISFHMVCQVESCLLSCKISHSRSTARNVPQLHNLWLRTNQTLHLFKISPSLTVTAKAPKLFSKQQVHIWFVKTSTLMWVYYFINLLRNVMNTNHFL